MGGDGPRFSAVGSDFNNDRAVDFVVAGKSAQVLLNPREGKFPALEGAPAIKDAVGVAVLDFNKDGWMDLAFTHSAAPGLTLWRNVDGKKLEQVSLPDLHWTRAWGIAPIEYDNDGYIDSLPWVRTRAAKLKSSCCVISEPRDLPMLRQSSGSTSFR